MDVPTLLAGTTWLLYSATARCYTEDQQTVDLPTEDEEAGMDQRSQVIIAFLLGACVTLGAALMLQSQSQVLTPAYGQAAAGGASNMFMVTGSGTQGQSRDVLFLIDAAAPRLAVYEYKDGRLELGAVRNIEYELRFEEWSQRGKDQRPGVKEMKDTSEPDDEDGKRRRR